MTLYEKIKSMSIDEMAEYLTTLSIGSATSFFFNIYDKESIKNLDGYEKLLNEMKALLIADKEI